MAFRFFRRASSDATGRFCCYGKMGFDPEFLRFHVDSAEGRWLVSWIDEAHKIIAGSPQRYSSTEDVELRTLVTPNDGRNTIAALIRPSSDAGGRSYPLTVFTVRDTKAMQKIRHLSPLWISPLWAAITRAVLDEPIRDREALAAVLDATDSPLDDPEVLGKRFQEVTNQNVDSPWMALTGLPVEKARAMATTLIQLARMQRDARATNDGVALSIPLAGSDLGPLADRAMQTAIWLRLFDVVLGTPSPWPAIIEVRRRTLPFPASVCIFGRPPATRDLAYLLAGVGNAPIDDVTQPWDAEPSCDWAQAVLGGLLNEKARCVADLWKGAAAG